MTAEVLALLAAKVEIARAIHRGVRRYALPIAVPARRILVEVGRGLTSRVRAHELRDERRGPA